MRERRRAAGERRHAGQHGMRVGRLGAPAARRSGSANEGAPGHRRNRTPAPVTRSAAGRAPAGAARLHAAQAVACGSVHTHHASALGVRGRAGSNCKRRCTARLLTRQSATRSSRPPQRRRRPAAMQRPQRGPAHARSCRRRRPPGSWPRSRSARSGGVRQGLGQRPGRLWRVSGARVHILVCAALLRGQVKDGQGRPGVHIVADAADVAATAGARQAANCTHY